VFVLCSAHEGSPRALLEAMSCGKAIVATEVGGIPDMLNGCGLLVPSARPDLLAQAIEQFLVDSALRAHLGDLARQRAQALFSMEREWTEYEKLYKSVLRNDALT
jgi:glycosyltransferase involved in cell wall biosynthesis